MIAAAKNPQTLFLLPSLFVALLAGGGSAEDWPAWRGPRGDGTSLELAVPTHWNETENISWRAEIPGNGHASPIVFGDYLFLVT